MRCSNTNKWLPLFSLTLLGTVGTTAYANPIAASYTVTDLGVVPSTASSPQFSTDANGNGVVLATNGTTSYPFPQTLSGTSMSTPANFPLLDPVPSSTSGTFSTYSSVQGVTLYPNGIDHGDRFRRRRCEAGQQSSWNRLDAYYVMQNPDGSWGQPIAVASSGTQYGASASFLNMESGFSVSLSKSGNILIGNTNQSAGYPMNEASVYNMSTQTTTDLATIPYLVSNNYSNLRAIAIDDDGRILVEALHQTSSTASEDFLLLTPAGLSPDPLPIPEPSTLAVMTLAVAAFGIHRTLERRQRA